MWTIRPEILEILRSKLNVKKNSREKVSENLVIPRKVVLFLKILENAVPFSAKNANQTFWLNGKRLKSPNKLKGSIQFWLKVWLLAWQSRNGNDNFLTCNSKFRSDQTDRSKRTTCGSGPLSPQAVPRNSKQSWVACALTRKFPHGSEAFHLFLNRNFQNFWQNGKNPTSRSEKKGDWKQLSSEMDTAVTLMGGSTVVKSFCIVHP